MTPELRCLKSGPSSLSLRECLTLALGITENSPGWNSLLQRLNFEQEEFLFRFSEETPLPLLDDSPDLDSRLKLRLETIFEIARRYHAFKRQIHPVGSTPLQIEPARTALSKVPAPLRFASTEWLGFVPFYRNKRMGELVVIQKGARTFINTDPAEFFSRVLLLRPSGFFLFHNHPSGDTTPSSRDWDLTLLVARTALDLGIPLLGHWIVTHNSETWIPVAPRPGERSRWRRQRVPAAKKPQTYASARVSSLFPQTSTS